MIEETEKTCTRCGESWPATAEFFYRNRREPDGLRPDCKACYHELPSVVRRERSEVDALRGQS